MKRKHLRPMDRTKDQSLGVTMSGYNLPAERILQRVGGKRVILLRLPPEISMTIGVFSPLVALVYGDPAKYTGPCYILKEPKNLWAEIGQEPTSGFNCHAYSLGDRVGLTPNDWVEGEPTDLSMDTNPMEVLLSVYFRPVRTIDVSDLLSLVRDHRLQKGDIISFTYERPHWGTCHLHSARVTPVQGENWLTSKFQLGRLVVTPMKHSPEFCPNATTVRVYRFRGM